MKREQQQRLLIGSIVSTLILIAAAPFSFNAAKDQVKAWLGITAQQGLNVNGDYDGSVTLQGVYAGTYDITTTVPITMDMGSIDLSLRLEQSGNTVSGYVTLAHTLVYPEEEKIMVTATGPTSSPQELAIGPRVDGTFDGTKLYLESNSFDITLNGQQITRKFSLTSASVQDNGATLSGTYRETIWGYDRQPTTTVGIFIIRRPIYGNIFAAQNPIFLPIVIR